MPKLKSIPKPEISHDLPILGVRELLQWTSDTLPRMQWMSELVLDKIDANQELINDPLQLIPPAARKILLELPHIAWITIALFVVDFLVMISIVLLAEFGFIYKWLSTILLTFAMFVMFTVTHDASHGSISNIKWINGLIGRISFATIGPHASFPLFRFIHLMHHKYTNDKTRDPDRFTAHGELFLPLRCLLLSPSYLVFYLKNIKSRPVLEIVEVFGFLAIQAGWIFGAYERGYFLPVFTYYIAPSLLSHGLLGFFFDYIPHHHDDATTPIQSRYHTTSILQTYWFAQPILSLLLQYQDYHLIHHLYPTIPFYRYADKWIEKQEFLMEKQVSINQLKVSNVVNAAKQSADSLSQATKQTAATLSERMCLPFIEVEA